jgi:hypothetical protein
MGGTRHEPSNNKPVKRDGSKAVHLLRDKEEALTHPAWSREFLTLQGNAPDFPYPKEPPAAEPAPDLD